MAIKTSEEAIAQTPLPRRVAVHRVFSAILTNTQTLIGHKIYIKTSVEWLFSVVKARELRPQKDTIIEQSFFICRTVCVKIAEKPLAA